MPKRKSQSDHYVMVKQVADILINKRHPNVKADLKGYIQPNLLRWKGENSGHIPDVTSQLDGKLKLIEVETDDSINDQHTSDQWKLFATYAKRDNAEFIIVVPKGAEAKAEKRKNELNVEGEVEGI